MAGLLTCFYVANAFPNYQWRCSCNWSTHEFIDLKLTAAGLFSIFTKFPFNHVLRHANNVNQCATKIHIFSQITRLKSYHYKILQFTQLSLPLYITQPNRIHFLLPYCYDKKIHSKHHYKPKSLVRLNCCHHGLRRRLPSHRSTRFISCYI